MASIANDPNGRRRILFVAPDGVRKTIRLGKIDRRSAEGVRRHIEALLAARITGQPVDRETSVWMSGIGTALYSRLERTGLVPSRQSTAAQLGPFINAYIASRTDAKPRTIINLQRARTALVEYFGDTKPLAAITAGDADAFRVAMLGRGWAENTVRRICGRARQFFRAAVRREVIARNPFDGLPCTVGSNPARAYFVTRDESEKILAACPDAEWRLIFALARYGGLRTPSETLALRWTDIDWASSRMTVRSPKTERYVDKAVRIVPIFAELAPYLRDAFEAADDGAEYVIARYRGGSANLRTQLSRIVRRAGLVPWPKLFHNLRSSRQTELAATYPLHVACAWIGNSAAIAARHYLQVTDAHYVQAVARGADCGAVIASTRP